MVPVDRENDTIYVHAMPISAEVFDQNFMVIARTSARLWGLNLGPTAGPRIAAKMLRNTGKEMGLESETQALNNEIVRLANVVVPGTSGYETVPLYEALKRNLISKEDTEEVENILAFFIVLSAMQPRKTLEPLLADVANLWGGQIVSLNCTEYANSLRTSTEDENSGAKVAG